VTYWFGVVEGLLKMSSDNAQGQTMTFTGMPPGGWFGEGTALKRESYRYNIQALRKSVVAGLPVDTFHWLLDHSIGFNRFVMDQLNERLGQFIAAREIDRMGNPDVRVARSLAALEAQGSIRVEYGGMLERRACRSARQHPRRIRRLAGAGPAGPAFEHAASQGRRRNRNRRGPMTLSFPFA
jgi:CRP-like cAMP-binding protein